MRNRDTEWRVQCFRAAIGPDSAGYYMAKAERYIHYGLRLIDFNAIALLFGFLWFIYRRVSPVIVICLASMIAIKIFVADEFQTRAMVIWIVTGSFLGGFFGNQIYLLWINTLILIAELKGKEGDEVIQFLDREGGTIHNMAKSDPFRFK